MSDPIKIKSVRVEVDMADGRTARIELPEDSVLQPQSVEALTLSQSVEEFRAPDHRGQTVTRVSRRWRLRLDLEALEATYSVTPTEPRS